MSDTILDDNFTREVNPTNRLFAIIRWWEQRRLIYNAILLVFGLVLVAYDSLPLVGMQAEDWIVGIVLLAVGANLSYLLGWNFELLLAYYLGFYLDDFKRWVLWVSGVIFSLAVLLAIYISTALSLIDF